MKHNIFNPFCLILVTTIFVGCTGSGGSSSLIGKITDGINDVLNPDPSVKAVEKQISEIQNTLNQDSAYALTQEDIAFLKSEGLLTNENEIKGWVKQ